MDIRLRPGAKPVQIRARPLPIRLRLKVKLELRRMIELGVIRPVNKSTAWVHPMIVVDKKDGAVRVCLDPRHLNPYIERATFPLPNIDTLILQISSATVMSTLDLDSAFWQTPVTERATELLTFGTPWGRYQYLRLPMACPVHPKNFIDE